MGTSEIFGFDICTAVPLIHSSVAITSYLIILVSRMLRQPRFKNWLFLNFYQEEWAYAIIKLLH